MNIQDIKDSFINGNHGEIDDFVSKFFNGDYILFLEFIKKRNIVDDDDIESYFMSVAPMQFFNYLYSESPENTIKLIVDNSFSDVHMEGSQYYMTMDREDLSNLFDNRGRNATARDAAKSVLSDGFNDWFNDYDTDIIDIIDELDEGNYNTLVHKFFVNNEGSEWDDEPITSELMSIVNKSEFAEMINGLDDDLKSNLQSLYNTASQYAYEEELYSLVDGELSDFFGMKDYGKWITQKLKKIDGSEVTREKYLINVTNLLPKIIPYYISEHLKEDQNMFEYQGSLEYVINDYLDMTDDRLDFRVPEYPDYSLTKKNLNDLFSDYI